MTDVALWLRAFVIYTRYVKAPRYRRTFGWALGPILRRTARLLSFPPADSAQRISSEPMPRIIWIYWADGEEAAPDLVRRCISTWREMNPGWDVRMLDAESASTWASTDYVPRGSRIQLVTDALRLELLRQYGGVWVDATCLCTRPLDDWLVTRMDTDFFAFSRPGLDRPLGNWFLAAAPGGRLISIWAAAERAYWEGGFYSGHIGPNGRRDQFISHYLFDWMIHACPNLGELWSVTPVLSARPPHYLQAYLKSHNPSHKARMNALKALRDEKVPVHKLDWRIQNGIEKLDKILQMMTLGR